MKRLIICRMLIGCAVLLVLCSCSTSRQSKFYPIRQLAPDGAWTWYNDERTIVDGQTLIIGSLDSQGVSRVDLYDMRSGRQAAYPLSSWKAKDDHNNPALLKMSNGKILACYSRHNQQKQWNWRIADSVGKSVYFRLQWGPEQVFKTGANTTYCNLMQLADESNRIYNFSRNIGWNPNIQYSDDMGQTWQGPFQLIKSGDRSTRPYVKYADNGKDRIDLLYTDGHPRNEPTNSVYHMYYKAGSFYKSDGTLIKTMAQVKEDPMIPTDGTLIYDGTTEGRGWVWDIEYDADSNPVAAFINSADHEVGSDLRYRLARFDSKTQKWQQRQIAFAGTHLYVPENHYAGGITIDPDNADTVYISTDVDPTTGEPDTTGRYQIFQGKSLDHGRNWNWKQLTFDTAVDNLRPFVPRDHGRSFCVLWFRGQYNTYKDFKTSIVGIIEK